MTGVKSVDAFQLARMAEVASPDTFISDGAAFLVAVRNDVVEAWEAGRLDLTEDGEDDNDVAHEIADGAVPIYTYRLMSTMVDLAAWDEDVEDLTGGGTKTILELVPLALYVVAERLVYALLADLRAELADAAEDDYEPTWAEADAEYRGEAPSAPGDTVQVDWTPIAP